MLSKVAMRWVAWPVIGIAVALLTLAGPRGAAASPVDELHAIGPGVAAIDPGDHSQDFIVDIDVNTDSADFYGYQYRLDYDPTILTADSVSQAEAIAAGITLCATPDLGTAGTVISGCASLSAVGAFVDGVEEVTMHCDAQGTSPLTLVSYATDPAFGSTLIGPGGAIIPTTLFSDTVDCEPQADLYIISTHAPEPVVAGETFVKEIMVVNKGPNPALAVSVTDTFDDGKVYLSDTAPWPGIFGPGGCFLLPPAIAPNTLSCPITNPLDPSDVMQPGAVVVFTITFGVELSDAGKVNVNAVIVQSINSATLQPVTTDPNQHPQPILGDADFYNCFYERISSVNPIDPPEPYLCNNVWADEINVLPASLSIVKDCPDVVLMGDSFDCTIDIHSEGPSPATEVVVTDVLDPGLSFEGVDAVCDTEAIECVYAGTGLGGEVTCTVLSPMPVSETCTITLHLDCAAAGMVENVAHVTWHDGPEGALGKDSNVEEIIQLPPFNGMVKDARMDIPGIQDTANLWLCKSGPDCHMADPDTGAQIGKGILDVADLLFLRSDVDSPNDSDTDPEGLAAYEEQIKYDHKIFDLSVADAGDDGLDNDADTEVDEPDESVIEGWRGNINCTMTILTENWIMFGCVSAGQQLGNPMPVAEWLKTIRVTPDPDMFQRIRPTKDNGVVSTILDENCEVADIYASEPWPFTLPGGLTEDCTDITITVRMLEGDLNLDCQVNVLDEQIIAQRYGAVFGLLLYNPFFDLEPKLTDFDIDIKDLQFVFGRDSSECQNPIPDQDPEPMFPDP